MPTLSHTSWLVYRAWPDRATPCCGPPGGGRRGGRGRRQRNMLFIRLFAGCRSVPSHGRPVYYTAVFCLQGFPLLRFTNQSWVNHAKSVLGRKSRERDQVRQQCRPSQSHSAGHTAVRSASSHAALPASRPYAPTANQAGSKPHDRSWASAVISSPSTLR